MHVHVLFAHAGDEKPFGCSYIRLLQPLNHPACGGLQVTDGVQPRPADVLIVERTWGPHTTLAQVEALVQAARREGTRLLFTLDDNLLDLETITTDQKMYMRYLVRHADGVLVSTQPLAERMRRINPRLAVLPNQVDERLFPSEWPSPSQKESLTIGYMGTPTHDGDLRMVLQALRAVLRRFDGRVQLQLVGGVSDSRLLSLFNGLPVQVLRVPVEHMAYPRFVAWMRANLHWDLAIAPLDDTYFNRFKSDLKFLDYSALGFPGVYSRMPVYEGTVRHLETGYLADNTVAAWESALTWMLEHPDDRRRMAQAAWRFVMTERTLQHRAAAWREAIARLCGEMYA
ncbi:MAG: hypothetical protein Fur0018_07250 [Anaerolineales bacterium]